MEKIKSYHKSPTEREILIRKVTKEFFADPKNAESEDWFMDVIKKVNEELVKAGY